MKRSTTLVMVCLLLLMSLLAAPAALADDSGEAVPLDPEANACFDGGTLAGKCDTEDMWVAGWLLARVEYGVLDPHDVPDEYAWILRSLVSSIDWQAADQYDDDGHDSDPGSDHGEEEICYE